MKGKNNKKVALVAFLAATMLSASAAGAIVSQDDNLSAVSVAAQSTENANVMPVAVSVAKVGNTEYTSISEAIANWANGTTLTLLADVTLEGVIKLSSTEYHILDLGTYTMTAAKGKDAIEYVINGRSSAGYALDIKADATNPGGITATGKAIVSHIKPKSNAPAKDRPITRFYGGVFNASYVVKQGGTGLFLPGVGYSGASAPYFYFYGGVYNGTIYTNRSMNQFYGGTFNGSMSMSVDSSAYTLIAGGTFKNLSNSMGSALNSDKFVIGSAKGVYDKEVYVDDNGNYVIAAAEPTEGIEAGVAKTPGTNDYLAYSKVATEGQLNYTDAVVALTNNNTTSAKVTIYADEVDLTGVNYKGTIVVPEGNTLTIITEAGVNPDWKLENADSVEYKDENGNALVKGENGAFVEKVAEVANYDELVAALAEGGKIQLTADIAVEKAIAVLDGTAIDLNGKTLNINVEDSSYGNATIKNGNIVLGKDDVHVCNGYFLVKEGKTLVVESVNVSSSQEGIKGYAVFHLKTGANLDLTNSELNIHDNEYAAGYIVYAGESTATVDVVDTTVTASKVNGIVHAATVIENSTFTITNATEHGINRSGVTITDSTVAISGGAGRGITAQHGPLVVNGNSTINIKDMGEATIELRNDQDLTIADTATVQLDAAVNNTTSGTITGTVFVPVVQIGENYYETLEEAVAGAQAGDEIVLLADVAEDVTVPAGVIFNGNGKQVGIITAEGEITFKGYTKATNFSVKYTNTTINIGAGACLELTGTGRMVIGHGCTFNITGTIADAKTAEKANVQPSLIMPGASFTGAGVTFNVTNAYVYAPSSYCSSSKSASGTFDFNITNSIIETAGKLAFEAQSVAATVNFELKDSVLTTGSHLVFGVAAGEIVIDNSNVNVGKSNQIENRSTMTIKNGSVVNGLVATSSNAINPGTIIVEDATYAVTGQFSGSTVGTGTLVIKKGANVSVGSIVDKANVVIDATDMTADDEVNFTANLSKFTGDIEVVNNDKLEAKVVDGKIVLAVKPVASVGGNTYTTVAEAIKAAQNGDTVTLFAGEFAPINISNKNITIQGTVGADGELLTTIKGGNPAITAHGFNGTIKNLKIVDAWKVMYAEPAGNVTVDNIYVTGATYGLHLVAYTTGSTWTIQNSYMDLAWANSFGVSGGGDAAIVIKDNEFASTNPYYPDYGALLVNTFLPNVMVEGNVFGENAKINIDASITDTSKINISKNYHADGVDNAFVEDSGVKTPILEYYADKDMTQLVKCYVQIGENYYATLAEAVAAAQAGDEIVLLADAAVEGTLALPAGVTIKSNGYTINGSIRMLGDLTLNGALTITGGLWVGKSGETMTATLSGDKLTASYFMFQRGTYTINADIDAVYGYLSYEGTFEVNSTIHTTGANGEVLYINGNVTLNDGAVLDSDNSVFLSNDAAVLTMMPGSKVDSKLNLTASGAKLRIDVSGLTVGEYTGITGTVTNNNNGTIEVVNNDKLEAKVVGGKIVLAVKPVASVGGVEYGTLVDAFKAATEGCTIEILADVVVDFKWDCRDYAANGSHSQFKESVTINGNGHTIKFTGAVNDSNWNTIFRFEENATVNNLTIDISAATGAQRIISAKKSLTVDGLTVIGSAKYGVIFGEGASADDLVAAEIVVKDSTLTGTRRAISDNEGGKDVKSVTITGNTLKANACVSASQSIVFSNNVAAGEVDLRSYAAENTLSVVASDNTLTEGVKNYIYAKNIDAQDEFAIERPAFKVSTKAELDAAIAEVQDGDVIELLADITTNAVIMIDDDITINGNHYTITSSANRVIRVAADVTINNLNMVSTAVMVYPNDIRGVSMDSYTANDDFDLVLNNCSVRFTDASASDWSYAVNQSVNSSTGNSITIIGGSYMGANVININGVGHTVKIDGATLTSIYGYNAKYHGLCVSFNDGANTAEIKNTTFEGNHTKPIKYMGSEVVEENNTNNTKMYLVQVGSKYYHTPAEAIAAAQNGDTVTLFAGEFAPINISNKNITIQGTVGADGELLTTIKGGNPAITAHGFNGTIKDLKIVDAWKVMYAEPAGNVTVDNIYVTGATYGLHLVAYSKGLTWTIENSYMDLAWANSFGVSGGGDAAIVIKDNEFASTNPYYPGYGALLVNTFLPNVTVEGNVFGENAKINIDASITDTSKINISKNYHADGANNAFVEDSGVKTPILEYYADKDMEQLVKCCAQIGTNAYASLADAVAAAQAGDTITLLADVVLNDTLTVAAGKTIVLNLNGKTISQEKACTASYSMIENMGNLTITGNGTIRFTDTSAGDPSFGWGSYTIRNTGNLTVENGTIEHLGAQAFAKHMICAIYQYSGSTTINGGTISTPNYRSVRLWKGDMTINGGTFDGQVWVQAVDNTAKLTINGGTFGPNGGDGSSVFVTNSTYDVKLAVTDGTFSTKIGCSNATKLAGAITGGSFTQAAANGTNVNLLQAGFIFGEVVDNYCTLEKGLRGEGTEANPYIINNVSDLVLFRDSVNAGETKYNASGVYVALAADVDLAGMDWSVNIGDACNTTFDGTFDGKGFTIKNLTSVETAQTSDGYICTGLFGAIYSSAQIKNLTIENVSIDVGNYTGNNVGAVVGFVYAGNGAVIENVSVIGDININAPKAYGVGAIVGYAYYGSDLTIKDCSVEANEGSAITASSAASGIIGYSSNYNLAVENCTVKGVALNATAIAGGLAGVVTCGNFADNTVENVAITVTGANWKNSAAIAVGALASTSVTVSNTTYNNVNVTAIVGSQYAEQPTAPVAKVQAKIGDTYYYNFAAALKVAQAGETITLLSDVQLSEILTIDKAITLDGNGKMLTGSVVLADSSATIITSDGLDVTTNVADHKVVYANGAYMVVPCEYVAQVGESKYESFADALANVQASGTIKMLADVELSEIFTLDKTITIDTNDYTLRAKFVLAAADVTLTAPEGLEVTTIAGYNVVYEDGVYVAKRETKFQYVNLSVGVDLSVNFYVSGEAEIGTGVMNFSMLDLKGDEMTSSSEATEVTINGQTMWKFTFNGVGPHLMGNELTATLVVAGEVKTSYEYSIKDYAYDQLALTKEDLGYNVGQFEDYRKFLVNMLNYGAESQKYMDLQDAELTIPESELVTADLTEEQKKLITNYHAVEPNAEPDVKPEGVIVGKVVILGSKNKIEILLQDATGAANNATKFEGWYVKVYGNGYRGTKFDIAQSGNYAKYYSVILEDILVTEYDNNYDFFIYNAAGEEVGVVSYSIQTYVYKTQDTTKDAAALTRALWNYYHAAEDYIDEF